MLQYVIISFEKTLQSILYTNTLEGSAMLLPQVKDKNVTLPAATSEY